MTFLPSETRTYTVGVAAFYWRFLRRLWVDFYAKKCFRIAHRFLNDNIKYNGNRFTYDEVALWKVQPCLQETNPYSTDRYDLNLKGALLLHSLIFSRF